MAASVSSPRVGTSWAVQSDYNATLVSPLTFHNQPEVAKQVFDYDYSGLMDFLIGAGKTQKVVSGATRFDHKEFDSFYHMHTIESSTGTGAGVVAVCTLEEVDHVTDGVAAGNLSTPRKNDLAIVFTSSAMIKGIVTAVTKSTAQAHVVSIDPLDDAVDLGSAISATNSRVAFFSNAWADGMNWPSALSRTPGNVYNYVQIMKETASIDGSEETNKIYFEVDGKPYYYPQVMKDGDFGIRRKCDNTLAFGVRGTRTDPSDSTRTLYMNGGLEWYADNDGYLETYSTDMAQSDLDNIVKNLAYEKAPINQLFITGFNLNLSIDKLLATLNVNTAIDYSSFGLGSAASRSVDFGFDGFRYGSYNFVKKIAPILNEQGLTAGTSLSKYPGMGFVLPFGTTVDSNGKPLDWISLRYKANDRVNRFYRVVDRGPKETGYDKTEWLFQMEAGLQIGFARNINKVQAA